MNRKDKQTVIIELLSNTAKSILKAMDIGFTQLYNLQVKSEYQSQSLLGVLDSEEKRYSRPNVLYAPNGEIIYMEDND